MKDNLVNNSASPWDLKHATSEYGQNLTFGFADLPPPFRSDEFELLLDKIMQVDVNAASLASEEREKHREGWRHEIASSLFSSVQDGMFAAVYVDETVVLARYEDSADVDVDKAEKVEKMIEVAAASEGSSSSKTSR